MPSVGSRAQGGHVDVGRESRDIGTLFRSEVWWRDQYDDIKLCGYQLRPRYSPGWVPSWKHSNDDFFAREDGQPCLLRAAMDAIRIHDGKRVMLKKVLPEEGPHELEISRMFSGSGVATNSRNHCVPLLDVIKFPNSGHQLMVMPFLRPFDNPHFQTFGEFVAFFTQVCEGLQFMHERNVAHRDCTANNIMLDPSRMYPDGFHPTQINRRPDFRGRAKRHTRTGRPPRYYFIDFGLSREYDSRDAFDAPLRGGDRSAPEHRDGGPCNPFQTDIYYLGNLIREEFIQKYHGFEFMNELVSEMTHSEPARRPLIEEVVVKFARIRESLSGFKLRSPMTSNKHPSLFTAFHYARQAIRSFYYVVSNKSAIPQH
ncbi:kinase-like domain-containing protein [Lactarius deliciosus]|nr:kinase-like domain-containing protein [Lactarius deliciosus]